MAEMQIMPVRVADLLSDTNHMTTEQFGAYVRLLFVMWLHGGRLQNEANQLARIAGMRRARWDEIAAIVTRPMTEVNGELSQKRLTEVLMRGRALRARRRKAAEARWRK